MSDYILAIDQGTTGSTALLVGRDLAVHGRQTVDFPQHYPRPGWVEHDPEELWHSVRRAVRQLLEATATPPRPDRRHRPRQPARDHPALGACHRAAGGQRHRLAVPAQCRNLQ